MKKFVLTLMAAAGFTAAANAQAGSILVYGNAGISSEKNEVGSAETKTFSGQFNPGVGYQFNDNWTVGLNINFAGEKETDAADNVKKNTGYMVGPFVRYTQPLSNIFSVFGQANVGYLGGKTKNEPKVGASTEDTYNGFRAEAFPAIGVNVKNGFALNFGFGGIAFNTRSWDKADATTTGFSLTFGQQVNVGISKNFGGRKARTHAEPGDDTRSIDTSDDEDNMPRRKKARSSND